MRDEFQERKEDYSEIGFGKCPKELMQLLDDDSAHLDTYLRQRIDDT